MNLHQNIFGKLDKFSFPMFGAHPMWDTYLKGIFSKRTQSNSSFKVNQSLKLKEFEEQTVNLVKEFWKYIYCNLIEN
ncbi:CLUMA_CG002744, isoform A [Clunio marinus]|uniref:CLUMA_CG002744, isoform A n=1 Tax=Clunio marinus TaxID=568069 RepID=A0A1J1HLR5_9DIPT|nr:CLUMA_CG002744, isoform A [Clunio marinus]